jgi:hypothetical protein
VKQTATDVVGVSTKGINFPGFGLGHAPELDLSIISRRSQQGKSRMEGSPVNSAVMTFENIFNHNIIGAKEFGLDIHGSRVGGSSALHRVHHGRSFSQLLLTKSVGIPNSNSLIQRGRYDQIFGRVKGRTHDIVIVTCQHTQAGALVKVPQTQSLIIGSRQNPRELAGIRMKLDSSNVIQVTQKGKETPSKFVVPHFNFVIITAGTQHGLSEMEIHTSYWTIVLFESINYRSNAIIPSIIDTKEIVRAIVLNDKGSGEVGSIRQQ